MLLKKIGKRLDYLALPEEDESSKHSNNSRLKNSNKFSEFPQPSQSKELNWRKDKGQEIYKFFINQFKSDKAAYVDRYSLRSIFEDLFFLALTDKNVFFEKLYIYNDFDICNCCRSFFEYPHGKGLDDGSLLEPSYYMIYKLIKDYLNTLVKST